MKLSEGAPTEQQKEVNVPSSSPIRRVNTFSYLAKNARRFEIPKDPFPSLRGRRPLLLSPRTNKARGLNSRSLNNSSRNKQDSSFSSLSALRGGDDSLGSFADSSCSSTLETDDGIKTEDLSTKCRRFGIQF